MITLSEAKSLIKSKEVLFIDLKFTDIRGVWQHMTIAARDFESAITNGIGFDGSSIRGFQDIYDSDMLLFPDTATIFKDPFFEKTLSCICGIVDPMTGKPFEKDPRHIAKKAEVYLKKSGFGDTSYWGPEAEFFLFDRVKMHLSPYKQLLEMDSAEIPTDRSSSEIPGDGYPMGMKKGYFPAAPFDKLQEFRSEMVEILEKIGIQVEVHHHEVAAAGQVEIDLKYDTLVTMADKLMVYKYVARNLAKAYGLVAVFLPKPIYGDNGSGMHTHQSIFKAGKNIFFDKKGYGGLSKLGHAYVAGLLTHVDGLLGVTNPTVNSYRRLVPHFEAPTAVAFSARNRSAAVRIPMYHASEKAKRVEFRCPDPTCNPYLAFSAQLVAGIEGMEKKMDPVIMGFGPYDNVNIWETEGIRQTPKTLFETLEAFDKDPVYRKSGVFTKEMLKSYVELKRDEATEALMYPTVSDFFFYGDM